MRKSPTESRKIKTRHDVKCLFSNQSKQVFCKGAKLRYRANGFSYNRMMIALVRKYGNAVCRNRTKRIFREIYRNHQNKLLTGYDLAFILLPGEYETKERSEQFKTLVSKAGLFESCQ